MNFTKKSQLRILIISHNAMNLDENNGRTLRNLFCNMPCEKMAHLYFHTDKINAPFCDDFYRITDFDIKESILKFKRPGRVIKNLDDAVTSEKQNSTYGKYSRKSPLVRLVRDFIWGIGTWKTKTFKKWLREIAPNVVFFYGSDCVFSQRIARWIQKFLKIPMLIYWVDDFYLRSKRKAGLLSTINNYRYRNIAKKNIKSSLNVCITPMMASDYKKEFGIEFNVLFNSSCLEHFASLPLHKPLKMSYLGNISAGRYNSIIKIGQIIHDNALPIDFSVYSSEFREEFLSKIYGHDGFVFKGKIPYEEVIKAMRESDLLLHVEDFSKANIDICRYSLSTKIADCLASNRCLLCYGPDEVASMHYLKESGAALVANSEEELYSLLFEICKDTSIINRTSKKGLDLWEKNHNMAVNCTVLLGLLTKKVDEWN